MNKPSRIFRCPEFCESMFLNNPFYSFHCALALLAAPTSLLPCREASAPKALSPTRDAPTETVTARGGRLASPAIMPSTHFCSLSKNTHGPKAQTQVSEFSRNNSGGQDLRISQRLNLQMDEPPFETYFQRARILVPACQRLKHLPRAPKRQRENVGR